MDSMFGGFGANDGTLDFYLRINTALQPDMTIVDLGAGRGAGPRRLVHSRQGSFR